MKHLRTLKTVLWSSIGIFLICLMIVLLVPMLNKALYVAPADPVRVSAEENAATVRQPEKLLLTAIYQKEKTGKIEAVYIEVFHTDTGNAYYMEVPVHTKVTLSSELYHKLQAYSPELPQYLKLANMGESFSEEYCMTGCNRILSEVLGVEIMHYVVADREGLDSWWEGLNDLMKAEEAPQVFFLKYDKWLQSSESDLTLEERWVYYESYRKIILHETEKAPGAEGPTEYIVSEAQARSRLQEYMLK